MEVSVKKKIKKISSHIIVHTVLLTFSIFFLFPFLWMLSIALKTDAENMVSVGGNFIVALFPKSWEWGNFAELVNALPFFRYIRNSLIVTMLTVIGTILSATFVAYAFAKLRWPGRKPLFMVLMITMMMPGHVLLLSTYKMYSNMGVLNTYIPLVLPAYLGGGAFNVFLFKQFYESIPNDLSEAARIDGARDLGIWWRIILPLCKPAIATIAIFSFMFSWNDFLGPLIYLNNPNLTTLPLGLRSLQQKTTRWNLLMAGSLLALVPMLILFLSAQKYFVEGMKLSGLKG